MARKQAQAPSYEVRWGAFFSSGDGLFDSMDRAREHAEMLLKGGRWSKPIEHDVVRVNRVQGHARQTIGYFRRAEDGTTSYVSFEVA